MTTVLTKHNDINNLKEFINDIFELPEGYKIKEIRFIPTKELNNNEDEKSVANLEVKDVAENRYIIEMRREDTEQVGKDYLKKLHYCNISYIEQLKESIALNDSLPIIVISLVESKIFSPFIKIHNISIDDDLKDKQDMKDYLFIEFGKFKKQLLTNIPNEWIYLFKSSLQSNTNNMEGNL